MSNTTEAIHLHRTLKNNDNNDITIVLAHPKKKNALLPGSNNRKK